MSFAGLFGELVRFETELWDAVEGRLMANHQLRLSWFEPMKVIEHTPDCRVQDIARALSITVGGVSKLIDRIEKAGYCRRSIDPEDRRSSTLSLTDPGRALLVDANKSFEEVLQACFVVALSPDELSQFNAMLLKLRSGMHDRRQVLHSNLKI